MASGKRIPRRPRLLPLLRRFILICGNLRRGDGAYLHLFDMGGKASSVVVGPEGNRADHRQSSPGLGEFLERRHPAILQLGGFGHGAICQ